MTVVLSVLVVAACQVGPTSRPVPSVATVGAGLHCANGDHGYEDFSTGWGFCYPATWQYRERSQASLTPRGLDLTFDITDIPCATPTTAPGAPSVRPSCAPDAGLFAFMIISTYERGGAPDLTSWLAANVKPAPTFDPIRWGNSIEAGRLPDGKRIALTPSYVVILDLHSGAGNLNLEAQMSTRLDTWKFTL